MSTRGANGELLDISSQAMAQWPDKTLANHFVGQIHLVNGVVVRDGVL